VRTHISIGVLLLLPSHTIISSGTATSMLELVDMRPEQDRGWTIKTERDFASLRGGARSFYESQATHPIYGETIPARSIDEQTAYQETLARIGRIESQMSPAMPMVEVIQIGEVAAEARADTATEAESANSTPDVETDTATIVPPVYDLSSAIPMPGDTYKVAPPSAPGHSEQENEQVIDPLAAEFGHTTRPLNLTRRVVNRLANHRQIPRRRPAEHIILK
jgi:hypothetical protein